MNKDVEFIDFGNVMKSNDLIKPNSALNKLREQNAISEELNYLVKTCKGEEDLLLLRSKIVEKSYENLNKGNLLSALDEYISEKLVNNIREVKLLEKRRREYYNLILGAICIVIASFFLTRFFSYSVPVAIVLAVFGWIGSDDRKDYKASQDAMKILKRYEAAGYQIDYNKEEKNK